MQHTKSVRIRGERGIDTEKRCHEVGPLVRIPPKSHYSEPFHRNFIKSEGIQSFVPKSYVLKFPIGFQSSKNSYIFSFVPKGGLES